MSTSDQTPRNASGNQRNLVVSAALFVIIGAIFGYFEPVTGAGADAMQSINVIFMVVTFGIAALGKAVQAPTFMWCGWVFGWFIVGYTVLNWSAGIVH